VWLAADGSAALGDFGIASREGMARLTEDGVVVGTLRYLSPEQIRGDGACNASDLYALGVTLYELATGRVPFAASDPSEILMQHLVAQPLAPSLHEPAVSPELERLILALLAKQPDQRPASALDVQRELTGMASARRASARRGILAMAAVSCRCRRPRCWHATPTSPA
jgi:serine/threonine protein kinase